MDNDWYMLSLTGKDYWYRDKTSLGKYNIRLQNLNQFTCFTHSLDNAEWICEVLDAEITSEFTG